MHDGTKFAARECRSGYAPTPEEKIFIKGVNPCAKSIDSQLIRKEEHADWKKDLPTWIMLECVSFFSSLKISTFPEYFNISRLKIS